MTDKNYFMQLCYYFLSFILLSLIIVLIYSFAIWRKGIPAELFIRALKEENNGEFEEALAGYKIARHEFDKIKSHSR